MALFSRIGRVISVILISAVTVGVLAALAWFAWQYRITTKRLEELQNPTQSAAVQVEELVEAVSDLIILPEEVPTVATITDKNQLDDQAFFAKAENGDKVLIYANAKKAYMYRPSTGKLIDVAAFNLSQQTPE